MTESFFTTLKTAAESVGVSVTDNQCEKLYKFYETVVEYNKNVNLTAITDEKEFIVKHIVDSISAAKLIKENAAVVDIGAGAGFPSIPLKIIRDDIVLIMLDALSKRVDFLNFAVSELSLKNAKAKHLRASADVVVARAVGQTNILLELSIPLLKKHGVFINYKGKDLSDVETAKTAEAALNAKKTEVFNFCLPFDAGERNIVVYEKIEEQRFFVLSAFYFLMFHKNNVSQIFVNN